MEVTVSSDWPHHGYSQYGSRTSLFWIDVWSSSPSSPAARLPATARLQRLLLPSTTYRHLASRAHAPQRRTGRLTAMDGGAEQRIRWPTALLLPVRRTDDAGTNCGVVVPRTGHGFRGGDAVTSARHGTHHARPGGGGRPPPALYRGRPQTAGGHAESHGKPRPFLASCTTGRSAGTY